VGSRGVDALDALPLSKITQSQAYKVHASETFDKDTLTIYERA
jgi:diaminohydroxyphosphoribosylaminopyrimidine deaminase/5-amino-6-(5-phosphoribosylamino)uracil reductase